MVQISRHRLPEWQQQPHALTEVGSATYLENLRTVLDSFGQHRRYSSLAPPRSGFNFFGLQRPLYNTGFIRGLASGERIMPGFFVRAQEMFPQLTRLFASTHEVFHHVDTQMAMSLPALARQFPELASSIEALNLSSLTRNPTPEAITRAREFMDRLTPEQRNFMHARMEVFADSAAAIHLLDRVPGAQTDEFLRAWGDFRRELATRPGHGLYTEVAASMDRVMDAYRQAVARGEITPGTMGAREIATFVQRHLDQPEASPDQRLTPDLRGGPLHAPPL